eukprot:gnl/TRDRNA2_/TRDRNA2_144616_c1_seq1.p1 gnl/TRDRNA2_/TRDRNA2_144616_c1~~gnl/TRDRNA2_/TRDRNA2_144616_c1_seq1.p1  ORF type:complete len:146 (-),score=18.35 gnl/TRDRNA2_/TRDRNA2_144616_c1_seq1:8-445(-)
MIAAGGFHTVLLRSDGTAVACGSNGYGQCQIPSLRSWTEWLSLQPARLKYSGQTGQTRSLPTLVLQASFDGTAMHFVTLGGEERCQIKAAPIDRLADIHVQLLHKIGSLYSRVEVVLPGGELLTDFLSEHPLAVLGDANVSVLSP